MPFDMVLLIRVSAFHYMQKELPMPTVNRSVKSIVVPSRRHRPAAFLVTCLLGAAIVGGCAARQHRNKTTPPSQPAPRDAGTCFPAKPLRVICITTCVNEPFFMPVAKGADDAAKLMDVHCDFVGTQGVNIPAQVQMVRDAIAANYDGIAINVIDATAFDEVIAEARGRGIPVVAFNVNGQPNSRIATVGQNLYEAGKSAGFAAADLIPPQSQVLITGHEGDAQAVDRRSAGVRDGLKSRNLDWCLVATGGSAEDVAATITRQLQANPQIKVIVATGQTNTEGAGLAIERHFKDQGYIVIGFDVSPEILRLMKAGVIQLTVDQQPYAQGFYPVVQLALAARHIVNQPANIDTGAQILTPNTLPTTQP